tara:strand:- start:1403 stop:1822 length:420 start_codon:yes stop_codon:yes gene_type:complete
MTTETQINHNIRIITIQTGENIICNFTQVREEDKFVAYQLLYPLVMNLESDGEEDGNYRVNYRRWNVFTPYEDFRLNPSHVVTAMPPNQDILVNYVAKLKEAGVDLSFIPDNGEEILNGTDGNRGAAAETSGPVAASVS